MRLLADESIDAPLVEWLRQLGHDVASVAEGAAGTPDLGVALRARGDRQFLVTFDRDFGELAFRHRIHPEGIACFRIPPKPYESYLDHFKRLWPAVEPHLLGNFVTASPRRVRVRPLPRPRG